MKDREPVLSDLLTIEEHGALRPVSDTKLWQAKVADIRARMVSVIGRAPAAAPPLDLQVHEETATEAYLRRLVSYQVEPGERVRAYLLIPMDYLAHRMRRESWENRGPAVLCLHQTVAVGKKEPVGLAGSKDLAYAHELAERGYICLAPDHLAAGDRIPESGTAFDTSDFYASHPGWSAVGKAVWDAERAVDALLLLPEVDKERIGVIGHSLGGHSAMFAAACDTRIRACVCNCGLTTFAANENRTEWCRTEWYVYVKALRAVFEAGGEAPFDFHEAAALIAPRAFLNISSLTDPIIGTPAAMYELAERVREAYGLLDARQHFATHFHDLGHSFPPDVRELAYGWLDRALAAD